MRILIFLTFALLLAGCTTLTREQCLSTSWEKEGFDAGVHGRDPSMIINGWNQNCGKDHNIFPDKNAFDTGFQKGRAKLCTKDGGYSFGRAGGHYVSQCSQAGEDEFFEGYQRGQAIYSSGKIQDLEIEIKKLKKDLRDSESRNDDLEDEVRKLKDSKP